MPESAARAVVAPPEKAVEPLSSVAPELAATEHEVAAPELGAAPMVDVATMAARVQRAEAEPLARRDMLARIQSLYGNRYAAQVIAQLRAGGSAEAEAETEPARAAEPMPRTVAPAVTAPAPSPAPAGAAGGAPALQAKAVDWVSSATDPAEREADSTARQIMRMPGPAAADAGAEATPGAVPPPATTGSATIARKSNGSGTAPTPVSAGMPGGLSGGAPLTAGVRGFMEPRFNADFGHVRVHTGETPARLSGQINAKAFTVGSHVYFGKDQYSPESSSGRELIAHELTHTIQQGAATQGRQIQRSAAVSVTRRSPTMAQRFGIGEALDFFAERAYLIPGFRMFTIILGVNPINMSAVDRNAANILRALIEFMPGGALITMALDNFGVFERAGAWVEEQIASLAMSGAAIREGLMNFLDSLSWTDVFDPGGVWERAKRIFTEPIDRLIAFARNAVDAIIELIKEAILRPLAEQAQNWAGYDLLRAVLGFDPITGDEVERTPGLIIGGFMKMIGQEEIWNNLQQANAVERAWAWFQGTLEGLLAFVRTIPTLFLQVLQALTINDIVEIPTVVGRVVGIFTDAIGRFGSWALQQVIGLLQIIFEVVAPGVMPYIQKAAGAFRTILRDPIGFVGNLVRAGIQGLEQFASNFLTHLRTSLIEWLTGTLGGTGVYIPQAFSLKEIIKFVLSVLGLTWDNIREKLVRRIGEPAVAALETGFDIVVTLVREGPAAAWEKIVEAISNLREMVMEQIMSFVQQRVVQAAITKLVTSLNPAGAVIQAILAIYNTIMFFIERMRQIAQVAMAFIDSIAAIASGVITEAANKVETTMAGLLTLVISFLARIAGLGRVSDAVKNIIDRVRAPIDRALERVIDWIVSMARKVGRMFGVGREEEPAAAEETADPEKQARIDAGLLALHQAEEPLLDAGEIEREEAESVAAKVKRDHPVFTSIVVVDGDETWDYEWTASPGQKKKGKKKKQKPKEPYNRRKHYGYTPSRPDRKHFLPRAKALGIEDDYVVDHNPPLVKRYYEGISEPGRKPGYQMTDTERKDSGKDRTRMKVQSGDESQEQAGQMAAYSRRMKAHYGL